ncbi:hypothetical protein SCLCIDRAFT_1213089 [Scleroderma citrinum Foug A]|uniref:Uncharacterized protein n=1 Tax=Scleroderma citrinum Foug A TaxID=1036808 RepID=A0A0C3AIA0_9AGAM|nr:hypothetical protein SCLCIDRAFT_1213089 [Scleroderma citrinum Foug A]
MLCSVHIGRPPVQRAFGRVRSPTSNAVLCQVVDYIVRLTYPINFIFVDLDSASRMSLRRP